MKIAVLIVRVLMGLLLLFPSVVVLFNLIPQLEMEGAVKLFNEGIAASVYLIPLLKSIELVCAIAFLTGRFVPLASVIIFPVTVNIFLFHVFLASEGLPVAVFLIAGNIFLMVVYRKNYQTLIAIN
jgi:putative oxidoreductase